jgi:Protein of unknown function (DUF2652)
MLGRSFRGMLRSDLRFSIWVVFELDSQEESGGEMDSKLEPGRYTGAILLADISGYTVFLEDVKLEHAEDSFADGQIPYAYGLMSNLLGGIVQQIEPPFTFVKFEGDAVFALVEDGSAPRGADFVGYITACYTEFTDRLDEAGLTWTCTCNACEVKKTLDLKFVVHHGSYFVQAIGSQIEVLGPDVTVAHRLMKNSAVEQVGSRAYALFTEAAETALDLQLGDGVRFTEQVEGSEAVDAVAIPLGA